jgi:hypothetical protein
MTRPIDLYPAYAAKRRGAAVLWWVLFIPPAALGVALWIAGQRCNACEPDPGRLFFDSFVVWLPVALPFFVLVISRWIRHGRWIIGPWV